MRNREFMRKVYRHFGDFVATASARELEYLIMDARYTSGFSYRMKKIIDEIGGIGKEMAGFSIFFNTEGDVAIIDANIVGRFIADRYCVMIEDYYKNASLNKIVRSVVNGNDKVQNDFLILSYNVLYETFEELYQEIKCRRDILNSIKESFNIANYKEEDVSVVVGVLLIMEDICKYIGIEGEKLMYIIDTRLQKKYSQEQ
jgi:hypothetical protein